MRRNWMIGAACALWLATGIGAYQLGHSAGARDHATATGDARQAGEDFQRAFYEGVDRAQAERAEKNRAAQQESDQKIADDDARRRQEILDWYTNYDARIECREDLDKMPEHQRAAFIQSMNDWAHQRAREIAAGGPL